MGKYQKTVEEISLSYRDKINDVNKRLTKIAVGEFVCGQCDQLVPDEQRTQCSGCEEYFCVDCAEGCEQPECDSSTRYCDGCQDDWYIQDCGARTCDECSHFHKR